MGLPRQLRFVADLPVIRTWSTGHHHGIKHLLVLAHQGHGCHLHAAVVEELGVLQSQAVFFGEGRAYRDAQNLGLNRARSPYGTEIVAITGGELRGYSGRWRAFDSSGHLPIGGDGLFRDDWFRQNIR